MDERSERKRDCENERVARIKINKIGISKNSMLHRRNLSIHWCHSANKRLLCWKCTKTYRICAHGTFVQGSKNTANDPNNNFHNSFQNKNLKFELQNKSVSKSKSENNISQWFTIFNFLFFEWKTSMTYQLDWVWKWINCQPEPVFKAIVHNNVHTQHSTSSLSLSSASTLCFGCHYIFVWSIYIIYIVWMCICMICAQMVFISVFDLCSFVDITKVAVRIRKFVLTMA